MVVVRVPVEFSQYWICADDAVPDPEAAPPAIAVGLATWQPDAVTVTAAHQDEAVDVEIVQLDRPAPDTVDDGWQDEVEFSLTTTTGEIRLLALTLMSKGPNLALAGPGSYRVRLSATDRDPINGKQPRERHRLQIWSAPPAEPRPITMTSEFSVAWSAPQPGPRVVDWAGLAETVGTRLIVHWWDLTEPPEPPENNQIVSISEVLTGSPASVFNRFAMTNPGGLARGGGGGNAKFVVGPFWAAGQDSPSNEHISSLKMHVTLLEVTKFSRLRFTWGFIEDRKELTPTGPGEPIQARGVPPRPHPLPADSIEIEMTFTKHPKGRLVTANITGVPTWLAADVTALWQLILLSNRTTDRHDWPWLEHIY
jgi:uncharacterized protein YndB with AHSA1/START domain